MASSKSLIFHQVRRFPLRRLRIVGGVIRSEAELNQQGKPRRISNFNALIKKDPKSGKLEFRVDFISHQGEAMRNHVSGACAGIDKQ